MKDIEKIAKLMRKRGFSFELRYDRIHSGKKTGYRWEWKITIIHNITKLRHIYGGRTINKAFDKLVVRERIMRLDDEKK